MSLIQLAAPLIRLAAADDDYAQDLGDAVDAEESARGGLVAAQIQESELYWLRPSEWQWFARWRQALGGRLDEHILSLLTESAVTPFARFEVRALVLRDPYTNQLAQEVTRHADRWDDVGLRWLSAQTQDPGVDPLELVSDSLQCATEASWFVLRELTLRDDDRAAVVREQLAGFAAQREVTTEITRRWRYAQ